MWTDSPLVRDAGAALLTGVAAAVVLRFWEEVANRALLDQKLCRKLVHITVGLVYFLMWPLFSSDDVYAPFLAPLIVVINIIKVIVIGLGLVKDEGVVNSMTRHGDRRYMCYFNIFGFIEKSWTMVGAFVIISLVAAIVESLPISTRLDDNLTVPLASVLVGALLFYFLGATTNLCCMSREGCSGSISTMVQMVLAVGSSGN
nr:unnamed protein product [Digitaria exilis]